MRKRLGNFIIAEDDQTLEGVVLAALLERGHTLATARRSPAGSSRRASRPCPARRRCSAGASSRAMRASSASTACRPRPPNRSDASCASDSRASHALAVLIDLDEGPDRLDFGGTVCIGIADATGTVARQARLVGGRDWVRAGAVEMGLDCLRRHLLGLPVDERIDFERR